MGTASTQVAAARSGRNSIGVEVDPTYFEMARKRLQKQASGLFAKTEVIVHKTDVRVDEKS